MPFPSHERAVLLAVKGVGPTVIGRLEQVGIHDLAVLAGADAAALCTAIAGELGASCWKNSPQARGAIAAAIRAAQQHGAATAAD
ncbi:Pathogenicity locus [Azospirillum sp. TSH64]|uniref:Pathogenicity locus n=1 Tax=Azospirillum sp. TSH64 TaxID=652740 RepID=UPI000D61ABDC|nr:Pathogenicity locus [Azospirillum sp. TSH64]PWC75493.1 Pathogenicity locus [Azospirillum sp. TSH64]